MDTIFNVVYTTVEKIFDGRHDTFNQKGKTYSSTAKILIDTAEIGEPLPLAGAIFRMGMDAKSDTEKI